LFAAGIQQNFHLSGGNGATGVQVWFLFCFSKRAHFREVVAEVKERGFKPSAANSILLSRVEALTPESTAAAVALLPSKKMRQKTFSRKRKLSQNEDIDPFAIPEELEVSFNVSYHLLSSFSGL
jgi:hypothetical protein